MSENDRAALHGLKVLEIAQLSRPMAGSLLADLGADVVHLEDPAAATPNAASGRQGRDAPVVEGGRSQQALSHVRPSIIRGQELARSLARWPTWW